MAVSSKAINSITEMPDNELQHSALPQWISTPPLTLKPPLFGLIAVSDIIGQRGNSINSSYLIPYLRALKDKGTSFVPQKEFE